jgi:hypothetical protein
MKMHGIQGLKVITSISKYINEQNHSPHEFCCPARMSNEPDGGGSGGRCSLRFFFPRLLGRVIADGFAFLRTFFGFVSAHILS